MKKLLRKNQIIITGLVVMVAMAGYLSMTERDELSMTTENEVVQDDEVADISDEDIVLDGDDSVSGVSVSAVDVDAKKTAGKTAQASKEDLASRENAG